MIKYLETINGNNVTGLEIDKHLNKQEVIRETILRFTTQVETIKVSTNDNFRYEIEGYKNEKIILKIIFLTTKRMEIQVNGNYLKIYELKRG